MRGMLERSVVGVRFGEIDSVMSCFDHPEPARARRNVSAIIIKALTAIGLMKRPALGQL
jgi:hypothetical protein